MATQTERLPQAPAAPAPAHAAPSGGGAADRRARRVFRPRRIVMSLIGAVLLTAAGVLVAIEAISALAGSPAKLVPYERLTNWLAGIAYNDWRAYTMAGVVIAAGLLFLLAGLLPGRPRLVPLHGDDPNLLIGITKGGLKHAASAAAEEVDGVTGVAGVKLKRRAMVVTVRTALREPGDLDRRVAAAVQRRVDELGPVPARRVSARTVSGRK
ncbi:DUF6286 domain-containing protein [Actinomadura parmotrematis]|uniref:DUF6286 domain-containing protein n=1 Tax=Actinomadura parmotrematis TaxID=2864039 RepID=A0ABS7FTQ8_9ACTN|nr:DUF6286 domain-containing protein [Actinomadura parmotrematis]MBW8483801.1 hypothetical protein [Actinomadura parmotrematis]